MYRVLPVLVDVPSRTPTIDRNSPIICEAGPKLRRHAERAPKHLTLKWSIDVHCKRPTKRLTWDDVCELWDAGVFTAEEIETIATLFFDGAELRAVLKVIEKVGYDERSLED